jgi:hypothetical protein
MHKPPTGSHPGSWIFGLGHLGQTRPPRRIPGLDASPGTFGRGLNQCQCFPGATVLKAADRSPVHTTSSASAGMCRCGFPRSLAGGSPDLPVYSHILLGWIKPDQKPACSCPGIAVNPQYCSVLCLNWSWVQHSKCWCFYKVVDLASALGDARLFCKIVRLFQGTNKVETDRCCHRAGWNQYPHAHRYK